MAKKAEKELTIEDLFITDPKKGKKADPAGSSLPSYLTLHRPKSGRFFDNEKRFNRQQSDPNTRVDGLPKNYEDVLQNLNNRIHKDRLPSTASDKRAPVVQQVTRKLDRMKQLNQAIVDKIGTIPYPAEHGDYNPMTNAAMFVAKEALSTPSYLVRPFVGDLQDYDETHEQAMAVAGLAITGGASFAFKNLKKLRERRRMDNIIREFRGRLATGENRLAVDADQFTSTRNALRPSEILSPGSYDQTTQALTSIPIRNQSRLEKSKVISMYPQLKETVENMPDDVFKNTYLNPQGRMIVAVNDPKVIDNLKSKHIGQMGFSEYVDKFNDNIDRLNEIIAKNNQSGIPYKVVGFDGYRLEIQAAGSQYNAHWHVSTVPGTFKGELPEIGNARFYDMDVPGISMNNTSSGIRPGQRPPGKTRAYESINEYLKEFDMGRVKDGGGGKSQYSGGLWGNKIRSGEAIGFHHRHNSEENFLGVLKTNMPWMLPAWLISEMDKGKQ